jgi:hypothetical protein
LPTQGFELATAATVVGGKRQDSEIGIRYALQKLLHPSDGFLLHLA